MKGVLTVLMMVGLAACVGHVDGDNRGDHGCSISRSPDFQNLSFSLKLDHNDPQECPKSLNVGESGSAGGTIVEMGVSYPHGPANGIWVNLKMYDGYSFGNWTGSGQLASDFESFQWDFQNRWSAEVWSPFTAGASPDFGEFKVDVFSCCYNAVAVNTINYWQDQM